MLANFAEREQVIFIGVRPLRTEQTYSVTSLGAFSVHKRSRRANCAWHASLFPEHVSSPLAASFAAFGVAKWTAWSHLLAARLAFYAWFTFTSAFSRKSPFRADFADSIPPATTFLYCIISTWTFHATNTYFLSVWFSKCEAISPPA